MFPGQKVLRNESFRTLWNPSVKSLYVDEEKEMGYYGVARYYSTSKLLMEHMTKCGQDVDLKKACDRDVWVGWSKDIVRLV